MARVFPKDAVEHTKVNNSTLFLKFVNTTRRGYILGDMNDYHKDLITPGYEEVITAGFVGILFGESGTLSREVSTSLNIGPKREDAEGLSKLLGIPIALGRDWN